MNNNALDEQQQSETYLGVARNCNINKSQGRISIAESNNRNVDVRSLSDGLLVSGGVSDNQQPGFTEGSLEIQTEQ